MLIISQCRQTLVSKLSSKLVFQSGWFALLQLHPSFPVKLIIQRLKPLLYKDLININLTVYIHIHHASPRFIRRVLGKNLLSQKPPSQHQVLHSWDYGVGLLVEDAKLRQRGVLVLDAPCDRVSKELVDRYLHLKARNLL